jgi:hypothetical protein
MATNFLGMSASDLRLKAITEGKWLNPDLQIDPRLLSPDLLGKLANAVIGAMPTRVTSLKDELAGKIPIAREGELITSDYHNALRDAVLELAGGAASGSGLLSFAPVFFPTGVGSEVNWEAHAGYAAVPAAGAREGKFAVSGWMPVTLPDGVRIRQMGVRGFQSGGAAKDFTVTLAALPAAGFEPAQQTSILVATILPTAGTPPDPNSAPAGTFVVWATADDAGGKFVVNNAGFRYFLVATVTEPAVEMTKRLYTITIAFDNG